MAKFYKDIAHIERVQNVIWTQLIVPCTCISVIIVDDNSLISRIISNMTLSSFTKMFIIRLNTSNDTSIQGQRSNTPGVWQDVRSNTLANGTDNTILSNVTGYFEPGKITAILGPSGAGKSTLMKIISGEPLQNLKGTVSINGIRRKKLAFRKEISYVPQQFALLSYLTTKETLYIAARLKLDAKESESSTYSIVNDTAKKLGLLKCLDTMANKLSGGERKRLSLGVEMVVTPSVLLLDEPTSGLDSIASSQLIDLLHEMARVNCTVVCAIHQPSTQMISHFDNIMVLTQGKSMYCGPQNEILDIFDKAGYTCPQFYNLAEFVLEVVTEQRPGNLDNLYRINREEYEKLKSQRKRPKTELAENISSKVGKFEDDNILDTNNNTKRLSTWQQQKILFLRAFICTKRDSIMTKLRFGSHILVALLVATFFYNIGDDANKVISGIACLFFCLLFLFFLNSLLAVQMFPAEAAVLVQEHLNNWYHLRAYYTVKILSDLPVQIICSTCFIGISYYAVGFSTEYYRFLQTWFMCILITILGQTIGVLTGTIFDIQIGSFLIPSLSIPLLLFSGFFLKLDEIPVFLQPLGVLSHFKYSFEGLMQAIYLDKSPLSCEEIYCPFRSSRIIMSMMNLPTMPFYCVIIILVSWILCFHVLTYAALHWKIYYAKK